jgi:uncharacterized SAM-binding protein YcdF (DUF218 family)
MIGLKNNLFIPGLLIVGIVFAFLLLYEPALLFIGDYLVLEDDLATADVIHVIAGEDYRTDYAIQLYQQGLGEQIFFTGGWCNFHHYDHGRHGLERARSQGVPEQAIAFDDTPVKSTYDEAVRLKAHIDEDPSSSAQSVIVVSDPFHMRRARWTYQRVLGKEIVVLMAPVPFDRTPYQRSWWKSSKSMRMLWDEYLKNVYYIFRYRLASGKLRDWLASLDRD